jgi:hypothetical protein
LFFIASISIWPSPAASETAVPDIPAKSRDARMLACPSPPGSHPAATFANLNIRFVIEEPFMIFAARIKSGIDSKRKFCRLLVSFKGMDMSWNHDAMVPILTIKPTHPTTQRDMPTGTPNARRMISPSVRINATV